MAIMVLVLYYSESGATAALAREFALGVESVSGVEALLRTVAPIAATNARQCVTNTPDEGALYVCAEDIQRCSALALGSPIHYGQMAAPLQHFFAENVGLWLSGALIDKPAAVFASGSSIHGGQEAALLAMMVPLLHHGAVICGIPYSEKMLEQTDGGGTPYGATRVGMSDEVSRFERELARAHGHRLALWAQRGAK